MAELLAALHFYFISPVLTIIFFALLIYVILGWLMIGGVVDNQNPTVRSIYGFLYSIIEPLARPIRRVIPPFGNIDLSILVIALAIPFVRDWAIPTGIRLIPF